MYVNMRVRVRGRGGRVMGTSGGQGVAGFSLSSGGTTELVASDEAEDAEPEFVWEIRESRLRCSERNTP